MNKVIVPLFLFLLVTTIVHAEIKDEYTNCWWEGAEKKCNYVGIPRFYVDNGWKEIDKNIKYSEVAKEKSKGNFTYYVEQGLYKAYFSNELKNNQRVAMADYGDYVIYFTPISLSQGKTTISNPKKTSAVVSGNSISYPGAYGDGFDLNYKYYEKTLKEELIIKSYDLLPKCNAGETIDLKFMIEAEKTNGVEMNVKEWDKSHQYNKSGKVEFLDDYAKEVFSFLTPITYDLNNSQIISKYIFDNDGTNSFVTISTPCEWFEGKEYPVYIDPTTSLAEGKSLVIEDSWIDAKSTSTNHGSETTMVAGRSGSASSGNRIRSSMVAFNLSVVLPIPIESVTNATYNWYPTISDGGADVITISRMVCNSTFNESSINYQNYTNQITNCGAVYKSYTCGWTNDPDYNQYNIDDITTQVNTEATTDNGMFTIYNLGSDEGSDTPYCHSHISTKEGTNPHYLNITYVIDTTPPVPTLTSVGGDASSPYAGTDTTPDVVFTTDENAYCRVSDSDQTYDGMGAGKQCATGEGTTSHTCTSPALTVGTNDYVYISCADALGNNDTTATNEDIAYLVQCSTNAECNPNFCKTDRLCTSLLAHESVCNVAYEGTELKYDEACTDGDCQDANHICNRPPTAPSPNNILDFFGRTWQILNWTAITDPDSDTVTYDVRVGSTANGFDYGLYTSISAVLKNATGLTAEILYYWDMRACDVHSYCTAYSADDTFTRINANVTMDYYNLTPVSPIITDNLIGNITCSDNDTSDTLTGYCQIYNESVAFGSVISSVVTGGTIKNICNITSGNTTKGENWTAEMWCGDGSYNTTKQNITRQIGNSAPTFDHAFTNFSISHSVNLTYDINASDIDGETLTYSVNETLVLINSSTGVITDDALQNETGSYLIEVNVTDGTSIISAVFQYNITNAVPTASPTLSPLPTEVDDNITLTTGFADADGDEENTTLRFIKWFKNSVEQTDYENQSIFNSTNTSIDDNLYANISVNDGLNQSQFYSTAVLTIGDNVAPSVSAYSLIPSSITVLTQSTTITLNVTEANLINYCYVEIQNPNDEKTNYTLTEGGIQPFYSFSRSYTALLVGTYYMDFYCQDGSGNSLYENADLVLTVTTDNGGGGGGGGGTIIIKDEVAICGNKICEVGENYLSCPEDCEAEFSFDAFICLGPEGFDISGATPCLWLHQPFISSLGVLFLIVLAFLFFQRGKKK